MHTLRYLAVEDLFEVPNKIAADILVYVWAGLQRQPSAVKSCCGLVTQPLRPELWGVTHSAELARHHHPVRPRRGSNKRRAAREQVTVTMDNEAKRGAADALLMCGCSGPSFCESSGTNIEFCALLSWLGGCVGLSLHMYLLSLLPWHELQRRRLL